MDTASSLVAWWPGFLVGGMVAWWHGDPVARMIASAGK
jgi:hypothetical protein